MGKVMERVKCLWRGRKGKEWVRERKEGMEVFVRE